MTDRVTSESETQQFVDIYYIHPDYESAICAHCGVERYFEKGDDGRQHCLKCNSWRHHDLEVPCPECDVRMTVDGDEWVCRHCGHSEGAGKERLIDRLTGQYEVRGYCRSKYLECPFCGVESLLCDPDGTLVCEECDELYAWRFGDPWYAYAVWMKNPTAVRIRPTEAKKNVA